MGYVTCKFYFKRGEKMLQNICYKSEALWMSEIKLMVPLRPLLSGERLQSDGWQARSSPQAYLVWSTEYSKMCSNILPTLEQDFQKTSAFLISFGNSHSLAIQGPKWSWPPHALWRDISSLNWRGPNLASLTHGSFCLVPGGSYSVTLRHRVTYLDCASGHPSFSFCMV